MSWQNLLAENRVEAHVTSKQELDALRSVVERNLRDAGIPALSADNRFGKVSRSLDGYRPKLAKPEASHLPIHRSGFYANLRERERFLKGQNEIFENLMSITHLHKRKRALPTKRKDVGGILIDCQILVAKIRVCNRTTTR